MDERTRLARLKLLIDAGLLIACLVSMVVLAVYFFALPEGISAILGTVIGWVGKAYTDSTIGRDKTP